MKNLFNYIAIAAIVLAGAVSCGDFLDRPTEDSYNESNFYQNDEQCIQGVNYLYNSPWNDFTRGYYMVGEVMSGNLYMGGSPYMMFTVNGTDENLSNMSKSLWAVNTHCSIVYNRILKADITPAVKNQCLGEVLAMKALAYFYLVRSFGDVPIIHDIATEVAGAKYNEIRKARKADVYEYIVMLLEKAMTLLPRQTSGFDSYGRIDYYAAEALLAKVYLTKAGVNGSLNQADMDEAARLAKDVIDESGRSLMENYEDIFRGHNNMNKECLISWRWDASCDPWTSQSWLHCEMAMDGFTDFGTDAWGDWTGPSVDLEDAFNVKPTDNPQGRIDADTRRKATMMMAGDVYEYFWRDVEYAPGKKGFDYLKFLYDSDYAKGGPGTLKSPTGTNCVKHLYGHTADHVAEIGTAPTRNMSNGLATHILRLADVYLIYVEAKIGANRGSTTDASAIDAFYAVRHRAIPSYDKPSSVSWKDVWKERRLELALEGDRWYDFVRLAYYAPDEAVTEIKGQRRASYNGLPDVYKNYYENGVWDASSVTYDSQASVPPVDVHSFILPFPQEDIVFNKNLSSPAIEVDVRNTYSF
jgi:hypothetical protein